RAHQDVLGRAAEVGRPVAADEVEVAADAAGRDHNVPRGDLVLAAAQLVDDPGPAVREFGDSVAEANIELWLPLERRPQRIDKRLAAAPRQMEARHGIAVPVCPALGPID